jgi:hypothetical protein
MPVYYFNLKGARRVPDEDGEALANDAEAQALAFRVANRLSRNNSLHRGRQLVATDAMGRVVCEIVILGDSQRLAGRSST